MKNPQGSGNIVGEGGGSPQACSEILYTEQHNHQDEEDGDDDHEDDHDGDDDDDHDDDDGDDNDNDDDDGAMTTTITMLTCKRAGCLR